MLGKAWASHMGLRLAFPAHTCSHMGEKGILGPIPDGLANHMGRRRWVGENVVGGEESVNAEGDKSEANYPWQPCRPPPPKEGR